MEHLWTDIIPVIVNFLAVVFILVLATRKSTIAFFTGRADTIRTSVDEATKLYQSAAGELKEWEGKARSSEAHSQQMFSEAKSTLEKQKRTTLDRARTEAERVRKEAGIIAHGEAEKLKAGLGREVVRKSVEAARRYLGGHVSEEDQQRLVTEYSDMVGNGSSR